MEHEDTIQQMVSGATKLFHVKDLAERTLLASTPNEILRRWGYAAALQLGFPKTTNLPDYSIQAMYLEFENVATPATTVTPPSFTVGEGVEYYTSLSASGTKDFIRIFMRQLPQLTVESGYSDIFDADAGEGNILNFIAVTAGTTGVHGKTFSNASNSKVYGLALAATPDRDDYTSDVIFARTYYEAADQIVKPTSGQLAAEWAVTFSL